MDGSQKIAKMQWGKEARHKSTHWIILFIWNSEMTNPVETDGKHASGWWKAKRWAGLAGKEHTGIILHLTSDNANICQTHHTLHLKWIHFKWIEKLQQSWWVIQMLKISFHHLSSACHCLPSCCVLPFVSSVYAHPCYLPVCPDFLYWWHQLGTNSLVLV